jgi:hypothetical protein
MLNMVFSGATLSNCKPERDFFDAIPAWLLQCFPETVVLACVAVP